MFAKNSDISLSQDKSQNQEININLVLLPNLQLIFKFYHCSTLWQKNSFFLVQDPVQETHYIALCLL